VYGTRRIRWETTSLYDLPVGRGKLIGSGMSRWADLIAGGWRLTNILTVQTGPYETPYFPDGEGDPSGTGSGLDGALGAGGVSFDTGHRSQHADRVRGVSMTPTGGKGRFHWTNANAFACPGDPNWQPGYACATGNAGASISDNQGNVICTNCEMINGTIYQVPNPIGRFGNAQVGSVEGPGLVNLSSGLSKTFAVTERFRLKAEGTFTNVLNHTNLGDPNMDLSSPSFGLITGTIGSYRGTSSDFGGARTGQVSMRLEF
jgi:hypothetical protein